MRLDRYRRSRTALRVNFDLVGEEADCKSMSESGLVMISARIKDVWAKTHDDTDPTDCMKAVADAIWALADKGDVVFDYDERNFGNEIEDLRKAQRVLRDTTGMHTLAAPHAASSSVARYSLTDREAVSGFRSLFQSAPGIERWRLASASIKLASTAKPSADRFGLQPKRLAGDTAYGSAEMLNWLVEERNITPHIPVIDKSARRDGTFAREDFRHGREADAYICPAGKVLKTSGTLVNDEATLLYRGSTRDCGTCQLKARCCPKEPARKIPRSLYQGPRDIARSLAGTSAFEQSRHERKRVEMLFAHLKRILRMGRLRLRGPSGARTEFLLAATAQNLRKLAKLVPQTTQIAVAT